jgi:hypothetical protein
MMFISKNIFIQLTFIYLCFVFRRLVIYIFKQQVICVAVGTAELNVDHGYPLSDSLISHV